jgi:hypothetical protein
MVHLQSKRAALDEVHRIALGAILARIVSANVANVHDALDADERGPEERFCASHSADGTANYARNHKCRAFRSGHDPTSRRKRVRTTRIAIIMLLLTCARTTPAQNRATREMQRLADAFVGDWDTTESMERSEYFPNGGERRGRSTWRLAADGTLLVGEGRSNGSAGPLSYLITIWWNARAESYGYFTCFTDAAGSSCRIRGSARWLGDAFVNEYEEIEHGTAVKWRDSFVRITRDAHTLVAARDAGDGTMRTLITSQSRRRVPR